MAQKNIIQNRNIIKRKNKPKRSLFETKKKMDQPLVRLTKKIKKKCTNNQHHE